MASALDIDEVVRRVMAEMGARQARPSTASGSARRITDRVITTEQISNVESGTTIAIANNAVVTPAAMDLLRERNIQIDTAAMGLAAVTAALLLCVGTACSESTLVESLERKGIKVKTTNTTCVLELVRAAVNYIGSAHGRAALLTPDTAAAVCVANRTAGIRAVHVRSVADLNNSIKHLAPNMLVVCPTGKGVAQLAAIIGGFAQSPVTECVDIYQKALG